MSEPLPELDPDEYEISADDLALPVVDVTAVPLDNPSDPEDPDHVQDDLDDSELEGMGAGDQQIWQRAVPRVAGKLQTHAANEIGFCLREVRIPNETPALALDAAESLAMCTVRHRVGDWSQVPRGTIGYFTGGGHLHGHVFENLGSGWIGTTDLPTGHWGRLLGADLLALWKYEHAFWAAQINRVTVWRPKKPQPTPKPVPEPEQLRKHVAAAVHQAAIARKFAFKHHPEDVAPLTRAIRLMTSTKEN